MRVFLAVLFLTLCGGAAAEDAPHPVAAVGLVGQGGPGGCSGVLIEPDLVLTAAHCIPDDPSVVTFRPGSYTDDPAPLLPSAEVVLHPLYDLKAPNTGDRIAFDLAMVRLAEPVPETVARPLPIAENRPAGGRLIVASYSRGFGLRARERACPITRMTPRELRLGCVVIVGESGAPAIMKTANGLSVAAIITARGNNEFRGQAFAAPASRASQLKALLTRPEGS